MAPLFGPHPSDPLAPGEVRLCVALLSLTWPAIAIRGIIRRRIRSLGPDDILILVSQMFFTATCATQITIFVLVPGPSPANPQIADIVQDNLVANAVLYCCSIIFLKVSLCYFFLRFTQSLWQRRLIYSVLVLSVLVNTVYGLWTIFNCGNPRDHLAIVDPDKCPPQQTLVGVGMMQAACNALTDITLTLMPIILLRDLTMKWQLKLSVGFILALATTGCASVISRFWFLHSLLRNEPFMRCVSKLGLATILELGTGILAACLATMKPLLSWILRFIANLRSSFHSTSVRWTGTKTTGRRQEIEMGRRIFDEADDQHMWRTGPGIAMHADGSNVSTSTKGTERFKGSSGIEVGLGQRATNEH